MLNCPHLYFSVDPEDPVSIRVKPVVTEFMEYEQDNDQARRNAHRESGDVDERIKPVLHVIAQSDEKIVPDQGV
jgi:hypothetical protein